MTVVPICVPSIIANSLSSTSQKCPHSDGELFGHPGDKTSFCAAPKVSAEGRKLKAQVHVEHPLYQILDLACILLF